MKTNIRLIFLISAVVSTANVLSCEKIKIGTIKEIYFNTVAVDIEKMKLTCIRPQSKVNFCSYVENQALNETWNKFMENSIFGIVGSPTKEAYDKFNICQFKIRVHYASSDKPAVIENDFNPIIAVKFIQKEGVAPFNSIEVERKHWNYINVKDVVAKNAYGDDVISSPFLSASEKFVRNMILTRVQDRISKKTYNITINNIRSIGDNTDNGLYESYMNREYR